MYFKCSWCGARVSDKPLYHSSGFIHLSPGFKVFCGACCSLSDYLHCHKPSKKQSLDGSDK